MAGLTHLVVGRLTPLNPAKLFSAYKSRRKKLMDLQSQAREQIAQLGGRPPPKRIKLSFSIPQLMGMDPLSESDWSEPFARSFSVATFK